MSQNFYTQENTIRFFHQFDTECPTDDASLKLWIQKNKENLKKLAGQNMFWIYKDDSGIKYIKFLGYFDEVGEAWKNVVFLWADMSLDEYLNSSGEDIGAMEDSIQKYTESYTEKEAFISLITEYTPIFVNNITEDTPEGIYMYKDLCAETDVLFNDPTIFGDDEEHSYDVICYEGYAIASANEDGIPKWLKITYPNIVDILIDAEKIDYVLKYRGLHDLTAKDIHYGDIMMAYGKIQTINKTEKQ